jgi:dihydroorotate dehydrogenase electron transfer subunit
MMKAIAAVCLGRRIPCQLALERHMACGVGTCQGCVWKVKRRSPPGWEYRLVCKDGPVFPAEELVW